MQDEATQIVWFDVYGMDRPPPAVSWRTHDRLTCSCVDGLCRGWWERVYLDGEDGNRCVAGTFRRDYWLAEVAVPLG